MKTLPPALAPLVRSNAQGSILAFLLLHAGEEFSIADVARQTGVPGAVAHKEMVRLIDAGILTDRRVGRARVVTANPEYPFIRPLTEIIQGTYGPLPILTDVLRSVPGVDEAYIYGSWAARYEGVVGAVPRDIDVLVVGDPSRLDLSTAADLAEAGIGRDVNITKVRHDAWIEQANPFLATVRTRPLVRLPLRDEVIA